MILLRYYFFNVHNLEPAEIRLPDGGLFRPDLLAQDGDGRTIFIEVEHTAAKDYEQRKAKWRNALLAGGGELYVICDNLACLRSVRSEINFYLGRQRGRVFLTSLAEAQAGKRAADGNIWLHTIGSPMLAS